MKPVHGLLLAACLVLAGCWESNGLLLDPAAAARPLADGAWWNDGSDTPDVVRWTGDGYYHMGAGDDAGVMLLTPLGQAPDGLDMFALATADAVCADTPADCTWDYAVAFVKGPDLYVSTPDCDSTGQLAREHGAAVGDDVCKFSSADELRAALAEFGRSNPERDHYRLK